MLVLPFPVSSYRTGASITPQLRRPWAAQSCTFRTSAMVASNQIPAATSTHEEAEHHGVFDAAMALIFRRLPFALAVFRHRRSRLWRIEMNVAAIVDDTILRFRG